MSEFLNPNEILKTLDLKENYRAADFGSGSGGWAIPLSKMLEMGKVYAIDVLEESLSVLRAKINRERISNIEIILGDVEKKVKVYDNSLDLVSMTNLLFECQDKKAVLAEGQRILRPGGKIAVIDWVKDNPLTKGIEQVSFEEIKSIAAQLGLKLEKEFEAGSYHKGLILVK